MALRRVPPLERSQSALRQFDGKTGHWDAYESRLTGRSIATITVAAASWSEHSTDRINPSHELRASGRISTLTATRPARSLLSLLNKLISLTMHGGRRRVTDSGALLTAGFTYQIVLPLNRCGSRHKHSRLMFVERSSIYIESLSLSRLRDEQEAFWRRSASELPPEQCDG